MKYSRKYTFEFNINFYLIFFQLIIEFQGTRLHSLKCILEIKKILSMPPPPLWKRIKKNIDLLIVNQALF